MKAGVLIMMLGLATASLAYPALAAAPHWVGSWATSEQIPEPQNALPASALTNATLRQIVHLSIGGAVLRVHISNAFGTGPLRIKAAHIARARSPRSSAIDPATDTPLTFNGKPGVIIPAGAQYISDPVRFAAPPLSNIAISLYAARPPKGETGHPGSRETSYLVHGNEVSAARLRHARTFDHWFEIAGIDVEAPAEATSIVVLGNSIADGHASTTNGNDRWSDDLARRLRDGLHGRTIGVLNHGIGGNRLLNDGLGPNALARVGRDVLAQAGVRYLIVQEGINDLGTFEMAGKKPASAHHALVQRIIGAYRQIIARAHAHGIRVYGGTLSPFVRSDYYKPSAIAEADREAINRWIRSSGQFDAVIDFDKVLRDPAHPHHLLPRYDSGDHLHPSPVGYRAMAAAIPLSLFTR